MRKVSNKERYLIVEAYKQINPDDGSLAWPLKILNLQAALSLSQTLEHIPDLTKIPGNKIDTDTLINIFGPITVKRLHKLWESES